MSAFANGLRSGLGQFFGTMAGSIDEERRSRRDFNQKKAGQRMSSRDRIGEQTLEQVLQSMDPMTQSRIRGQDADTELKTQQLKTEQALPPEQQPAGIRNRELQTREGNLGVAQSEAERRRKEEERRAQEAREKRTAKQVAEDNYNEWATASSSMSFRDAYEDAKRRGILAHEDVKEWARQWKEQIKGDSEGAGATGGFGDLPGVAGKTTSAPPIPSNLSFATSPNIEIISSADASSADQPIGNTGGEPLAAGFGAPGDTPAPQREEVQLPPLNEQDLDLIKLEQLDAATVEDIQARLLSALRRGMDETFQSIYEDLIRAQGPSMRKAGEPGPSAGRGPLDVLSDSSGFDKANKRIQDQRAASGFDEHPTRRRIGE
jgi:hypothetical protein